MSDEEIRDLLDLGADSMSFGPPIEGEVTWAAGRRSRVRRAWGTGLAAAVAAAAVVGVVWSQGFAGGDGAPPPPADGTLLGTPTETEPATEARGEPFFAQFERAGSEPPFQLSGQSEPATLEDLQGTWHGPHAETFALNDDTLTVDTGPPCHEGGSHTVELTAEGRLLLLDTSGWESMDCSPDEEGRTDWRSALRQEPLLSLDGETLLISGLDGTSEEPRVPASLTLEWADDQGFRWRDSTSQTGVTPISLGGDFQLLTSGGGDGSTLDSISELILAQRPGDTAYPGTCQLEMVSSLRSDGVLVAGEPVPWSVCSEGADATLPAAEPSPAVVALLRSGPAVRFEGDTMVISGTIPQSLLEAPTTPSTEPTGEGPQDPTGPTGETPQDPTGPTGGETDEATPRTDLPLVVGTPTVIVMSEGEWAPSGELTPLTADQAEGRRWLAINLNGDSPRVDEPWSDYGLTFDGSAIRVRACAVDVTAPGTIEDGVFIATGEPTVVEDPDPGADCPVPIWPDTWVQILTTEPGLSTDGEILTIAGGTDDTQLEPVGMVLLPDDVSDPAGGPVTAVTPEDLAAGLTEVSAEQAAGDVGVSDLRDPQPEHATTLTLEDGVVTVDVGCAEPLTGPAWFSQVGPEDYMWQLTAALPEDPDCEGPAAADAETWRQMLAHGTFLHRFGDHVVVDTWADAAVSGSVVTP